MTQGSSESSHESPVQRTLAHIAASRFTGLLRVRALEADGELWFLAGIREDARFGLSRGDEAVARLMKATDVTFEAVSRLPSLSGGFKTSLPLTGSFAEVRPVALMHYCETHALTCTLELESKGRTVSTSYQVGELISIDSDSAGNEVLTEMLESTEGSYRFVLPLFELPAGVAAPPTSVRSKLSLAERVDALLREQAEAEKKASQPPPPGNAVAPEAEARRRVEAEQAAAEAEAKRRAEAERAAAEAKRRAEAEAEAKRRAEAERVAAEAEARRRAEAERAAAEAESKRRAAEAEAKRKAEAQRIAETEAKRRAAEVEAKRKAEAQRAAAEAEAQRRAAEAEAKRKAELEAEQVEAKRKADAEAAAAALEAEAKRKAEAEAAAAASEAEAKRKAEAEAAAAASEAEAKRSADEQRPAARTASKRKAAEPEAASRREKPAALSKAAKEEEVEPLKPPAKHGASIWLFFIALIVVGALGYFFLTRGY